MFRATSGRHQSVLKAETGPNAKLFCKCRSKLSLIFTIILIIGAMMIVQYISYNMYDVYISLLEKVLLDPIFILYISCWVIIVISIIISIIAKTMTHR